MPHCNLYKSCFPVGNTNVCLPSKLDTPYHYNNHLTETRLKDGIPRGKSPLEISPKSIRWIHAISRPFPPVSAIRKRQLTNSCLCARTGQLSANHARRMAFLQLPKESKLMLEALGYREKLEAVDEGIRRLVSLFIISWLSFISGSVGRGRTDWMHYDSGMQSLLMR